MSRYISKKYTLDKLFKISMEIEDEINSRPGAHVGKKGCLRRIKDLILDLNLSGEELIYSLRKINNPVLVGIYQMELNNIKQILT